MDDRNGFTAGLLIYFIYTPLVLLAPVRWAPYVVFVVLALLLVLPLFLFKAASDGRFDIDQPDQTRVVYRTQARRGTLPFRLTALSAFVVVLLSIVGGSLYRPEWFGLFPWGVRIGLVALGLFVLSPKVPVVVEVLALDGERLRFRSRKNPQVSDGYEKPGEITVADIAGIRLSSLTAYDTQPHLYLAFSTRGGGAFRVLIKAALRSQVERFLHYLKSLHDAIALEIEPR